VTCEAAAWLWHRRKCRALATEIGLHWTTGALATPWESIWRVDLVGCEEKYGHFRTICVEVKGSYADLAREDIERDDLPMARKMRSKWHNQDIARAHELWVAVGDIKTMHVAVADIPEHWGVILFADDNKITVGRKAIKPPAHTATSDFARECWRAMAKVQTTTRLPTFFNSRRHNPGQRLLDGGWHEERLWIRDNAQVDAFTEEK
jgi:hypothetical protein